jgi:hypothetical protein
MKQTALQWFAYYTKQIGYIDQGILVEALEKEKQQIMQANIDGVNQGLYGYKNAKEYYDKNYKNK